MFNKQSSATAKLGPFDIYIEGDSYDDSRAHPGLRVDITLGDKLLNSCYYDYTIKPYILRGDIAGWCDNQLRKWHSEAESFRLKGKFTDIGE
jgi:hypothetical protein